MPRWQTDACLTVAMLLMVLGSGCGSDGHRDTWNGTVDTLDNGAVIVSNPITGVWDSVSAWRLEPVARIGSVEGDGAETFSNIIAFEIDVEGRIYVLTVCHKRSAC